MRIIVITPPEPVVSWEEIDQHLKLDGNTAEQALITGWIAAATGTIDGPTGWLGRAIGDQVLEARLDGFPCGRIVLPCPPQVSITSVKYLDDAGVEQTVGGADYELLGRELALVPNAAWPSPASRREAVRIRYRAGYIVGGTEEAPLVPAQLQTIKAAIMLMVGDLYRFRDSVAVGTTTAVPMSTTVQNLLAPLQVYA
jgi:uncharacterized phiE125 gp8 family phage protein